MIVTSIRVKKCNGYNLENSQIANFLLRAIGENTEIRSEEPNKFSVFVSDKITYWHFKF